MLESTKISEAEFFLGKLVEARDRETEYRHYCSAFLNAARSILQYAHKECQTNTGGQAWYDAEVNDPVIGFFKTERDLNIHTRPVTTTHQKAVVMSPPGTLKFKPGTSDVEHFTPPGEMGAQSTLFISFNDWTGKEDATELCRQYLSKLKALVAKGQAAGKLS
ncbi:hypothetical protein [Paludibaculum fermentans]|uniref:Uncharacterized protein n=1 Tax=Paludibaculum fermentans TaxID=1473598 RepID=A0A7S7SKL8_PALFE|nr:hypothetical protein [Paludibaculum fermentans]QOY87863.1 hypothetical protein IRI77_34860 [Paludibaculum fermentans]